MSATPTDFTDRARQWLAYAAEDMAMARAALPIPDAPYRLIAFHAQQAVEKALKAWLVFCRKDFPYTHSITVLLELCDPDHSWPESLYEAESLTPYAVGMRYPGMEDDVSREEAEFALSRADAMLEFVNDRLR